MILYYVMLLFMTLLGSVASLFLKKASSSNTIIKILLNKNLYIGGMFYLTAAIMNIGVLKVLDYSLVLPLTSLTYVWTMIISRIVLGERINLKKIVGIVLILIGVIFISAI